MHDLRGFSTAHFSHDHLKSHYEHQNEPDDSIYKGVDSFQDVVAIAATLEKRGLILQVQQEHKVKTLVERKQKLAEMERDEKEAFEKEMQIT